MPSLILASTSRYRRLQLEQLGLTFTTEKPLVDEAIVKAEGLSPEETARKLAVLKVESIAPLFPDSLILGGDQVAEIEGEILDKPETEERAIAQLKRLEGRTHHLWSAVALHDARHARTLVYLEQYTLKMRELTEAQIKNYVAFDKPLDCTGAYKIESLGIALFESIEGRDHSGITGLPLIKVVSLLEECGFHVLA